MKPIFQYAPELIEQFPGIVGGVIVANGLTNGASPGVLLSQYDAEQNAVKTRIGETPLSEISSLSAWRSAFRQFGAMPTKHRNAAEALLRRLTKKGDIPSINTLVDVANLVSIRYALPIAVFDTRDIQGTVTVRFAEGDERFRELGADEIAHPDEGEVIFVDENKMIVARRWCWRQSHESAARHDTVGAVITVEAQHEGGYQDVANATDDLLALLREYAGGTYKHTILNADQPSI